MKIITVIAVTLMFVGIWTLFSNYRKRLKSEIKSLRSVVEETRRELREAYVATEALQLKLENREKMVKQLVAAEFELAECTRQIFPEMPATHRALVASWQSAVEAATLTYHAELIEARQLYMSVRRSSGSL